MIFGKKKRNNNIAVNVEASEIEEDICVLSLNECLEFAQEEQQITHFTAPHRKVKLLRYDADSYQLICKCLRSNAKLEIIKCEDIKEVRYATECFELLKNAEGIEIDLCVTVKYKIDEAFLWGTFSFEAFDTASAQKWVHTLRTLTRAQMHKQFVGRDKEMFINRFPYFLESLNDNRYINAKDLKVFLCDMLNYKLGIDELNEIMSDQGLQEGSRIELSHLYSIYDKLIYDEQIRKKYFNVTDNENRSLFPEQDSVLTVSELDDFLSASQFQDLSAASIVSTYGSEDTISARQFVDYLYSEDNAVYYKSSKVEDLMDSPLCHYWIASSHNTYLTGNQLKSKSSVEAYVQVLLSGCKCIELDIWERQGRIMILHGYTLTTMVPAEDVLAVIDHYAFAVSSYPVILSIENHLGTSMQEKFAKMLKERLKDKLLIAPLQDGGQLPSPCMLRNKIIIKDKKLLMKEEYTYFQNIIKKGDVLFESRLNANDWTKRIVLMSSDFIYFSYAQQAGEDIRGNPLPVAHTAPNQQLAELHLAEPWYWGTVDAMTANHYISEYIKKMCDQDGPDVQLTGDFAIRPSANFIGEFVLLYLDVNKKPKKIKIKTRYKGNQGIPKYCIEEYHNAPVFESLYTLVKHYQRVAFSVERVPTVLRKPIEEPRNFEKETWFHYNVSLEDSERRIRHVKVNGAFLVREQPDNHFRLVFRCVGSIKQCRIRQDGRLWIIGKSQFEGLTKLVEYYKKYPLYVTNNNQQIKLTEAVPQIPISETDVPTYLDIDNLYVTEDDIRLRPDEAYEALEDYRGRDDTEMTFLMGAIIKNVEREPDNLGWCVGDYGPRKRKKFPYKLVAPYEWEEDDDNKDNPLGNMCEGMIQLKKSTPRIHRMTDNPYIPHIISIKCEGKEEYRLGFDQYEDMEHWFDAICGARKNKPNGKKSGRIKQAQNYSNLIIYAMSRPSPPEFTDEYISKLNYREMSSFDENKLDTYTRKPTSGNLMKFTNTCLARVYPKGTRTNSSNYDPLLGWNYGIQLVALNYQTPDTPTQLNFGRFNFCNGGCGYVRKPEDMISGKFNPKQEVFPNSIALFITVIGGRMLFSEAGNLPKVRISIEGLECDKNEECTRPAASSLRPFWGETLNLLCLNPDMAMIRFEVMDDNDFEDEKFIGHCTFPVKQLKTGYRSVPLYDGFGNQKLMDRLLVHVDKENLKKHDPVRELERVRREILQLNEYLNDDQSNLEYNMDKLREIEDKYFNLKFDVKLANESHNEASVLNTLFELQTLTRGFYKSLLEARNL